MSDNNIRSEIVTINGDKTQLARTVLGLFETLEFIDAGTTGLEVNDNVACARQQLAVLKANLIAAFGTYDVMLGVMQEQIDGSVKESQSAYIEGYQDGVEAGVIAQIEQVLGMTMDEAQQWIEYGQQIASAQEQE